jgi:hypothetical protein
VSRLLEGLPWVFIGGLMVRIAEAERGVATTWTTGDVDTVLDVRAVSTATTEAASRLLAAGFRPEPYDENLTYRFVRGKDIVDVLAPDNIGERADITSVPPGVTLEALGSRQALNRRRVVAADAGDGPFDLPVPSLLGAIILKARRRKRPGEGEPGQARARPRPPAGARRGPGRHSRRPEPEGTALPARPPGAR